jgi:CBS domain-containing protein
MEGRACSSAKSAKAAFATEHEPSRPLEIFNGFSRTNGAYISPRDSIDVAVNLMCRRNIGSLLIMEDDELRGIVTERDVLQYAYALAKP